MRLVHVVKYEKHMSNVLFRCLVFLVCCYYEL